jgi:hypothetical protein
MSTQLATPAEFNTIEGYSAEQLVRYTERVAVQKGICAWKMGRVRPLAEFIAKLGKNSVSCRKKPNENPVHHLNLVKTPCRPFRCALRAPLR